MEKYARQAVGEGVKVVEDIHIGLDSEIYRVLNLHYNRNNHIEVSSIFVWVIKSMIFIECQFSGAEQFSLCCRSDFERVLQSYSGWKGHRAIMEEINLQGDLSDGRSRARLFQVTELLRAIGVKW